MDWEAGETMDQMLDKFGPWDYTVFGILLLVSSGIGVYFAWRDRRNEGTVNIFVPYYMGQYNMTLPGRLPSTSDLRTKTGH